MNILRYEKECFKRFAALCATHIAAHNGTECYGKELCMALGKSIRDYVDCRPFLLQAITLPRDCIYCSVFLLRWNEPLSPLDETTLLFPQEIFTNLLRQLGNALHMVMRARGAIPLDVALRTEPPDVFAALDIYDMQAGEIGSEVARGLSEQLRTLYSFYMSESEDV